MTAAVAPSGSATTVASSMPGVAGSHTGIRSDASDRGAAAATGLVRLLHCRPSGHEIGTAASAGRRPMAEARPGPIPACDVAGGSESGSVARRAIRRVLLGELASLALPNAGDVPTSAFWESARPGVAIAATPSVRSGPDAWNHAIAITRFTRCGSVIRPSVPKYRRHAADAAIPSSSFWPWVWVCG